MKGKQKIQCGRILDRTEVTPAQEVLAEHGEIFSCGGVYLGLNRQSPPKPDRFEYLSLPNHRDEILVLNNQEVHRRSGDEIALSTTPHRDPASPELALRRFFKESLN